MRLQVHRDRCFASQRHSCISVPSSINKHDRRPGINLVAMETESSSIEDRSWGAAKESNVSTRTYLSDCIRILPLGDLEFHLGVLGKKLKVAFKFHL